MKFIADKQTLKDLNVTGKYDPSSLFSLFNHTITVGGEQLMEDMFRKPLTQHAAINERVSHFMYFTRRKWQLPLESQTFSLAEQFLRSGMENTGFHVLLFQAVRRSLLKRLGLPDAMNDFQNNFEAFIKSVQEALPVLEQLAADSSYPNQQVIRQLLSDNELQPVLERMKKGMPKHLWAITELDHSIRSSCYPKFQLLFSLIYQIDIAIAVGAVARERGWTYALAMPAEAAILEINNCRHPALKEAKGNNCHFSVRQNLLFLTGANMAGKSTYMKSIGATCYLAHMGFPVAADSMQFSVKSGIFTSINVADNLNQGISHFYAEVLRVKAVAASVCAQNNLLVIFDELFKGTNVKDAYDATLAVTLSFGRFRNCHFIISTHIIEAGEELKQAGNHIRFGFMPTVLTASGPRYTYEMQEGISADRQGMMIIEKEGVLDLLL